MNMPYLENIRRVLAVGSVRIKSEPDSISSALEVRPTALWPTYSSWPPS